MELINLKILNKHLSKNKGNLRLRFEANKLLSALEENNPTSYTELKGIRKDADNVYFEKAFFFNLHTHRILVQVDFQK